MYYTIPYSSNSSVLSNNIFEILKYFFFTNIKLKGLGRANYYTSGPPPFFLMTKKTPIFSHNRSGFKVNFGLENLLLRVEAEAGARA